MQHIFIVGSKSLGNYGGYETFVDKLTEYHQNKIGLKYHIACKANGDGFMDESKLNGVSNVVIRNGQTIEFTYHNARCFKIKVPEYLGPAQAIYYDLKSLSLSLKYIKENNINNPVVYVLACRIGPFIKHYYKAIQHLKGKLCINPDGHEWKRSKWSKIVRLYWKFSEQLMVKYSDLVVCDSVNIKSYIHKQYDNKGINHKNPNTTYIAYGADINNKSTKKSAKKYQEWCKDNKVTTNDYFLVVGRFVPENNYETIIREFMYTNTKKSLIIVTNKNDKFKNYLSRKVHFENDYRIKFVGSIYDKELLYEIRKNAHAYVHGHEVGGTNPSLLEALAVTKINLLLDVSFNKEVAHDSALYWKKDNGSLSILLKESENYNKIQFGKMAKARIKEKYTWNKISSEYLELWNTIS